MTTTEILTLSFGIVNSLILIVTVYVIRKSPSDAVKIGRELNEGQQKDNAKRELFFTLFSYRGSPLHPYFVDALNRIDIVFYDSPTVLEAWHKLYDAFGQIYNDGNKTYDLFRLELLSKMSTVLGYQNLQQYDMLKHYYPEGHNDQLRSEAGFRKLQEDYYKVQVDLGLLLTNYYSTLPTPEPPNE